MQSIKKTGSKYAVAQKLKGRPIVAEVGLVLMDLSLKVVAFDGGAAAILNYPNQPGVKPEAVSYIPGELLEIIRGRQPTDQSPVKTHVRLGKNEYICRAYLLEPHDGALTEPVLALHLEKDSSSASDAIRGVASKYRLTEREQEVLGGISMGLATKELASRMNISPNTVKAFLRLVMIKMGVTTRAGIVAKILHNGAASGASAALPTAVPQVKKHAV